MPDLIAIREETRKKLTNYLSKRKKLNSQDRFNDLEKQLQLEPNQLGSCTTGLTELLEYLTPKSPEENSQLKFLQQSLQSSLIRDLAESVDKNWNPAVQPDLSKKSSNRWKYILLAVAGTIFFGCEGFDGITAIFGIFSLPAFIGIAAGSIFSIVSIGVFHGFGLMQIAEHLNIDRKNAPHVVDELVKELDGIEAVTSSISRKLAVLDRSVDNIDDIIRLKALLLKRLSRVEKEQKKLYAALEDPRLKTGKLAVAIISGIIFFSSGYFAGQAVAQSIAALFIVASASFWPIIVAAVVVGLASLAVYWFVERPGIENLTGRLCGLDKDKIDKLGDGRMTNAKEHLEEIGTWLQDKQELIDMTLVRQQKQDVEEQLSAVKGELNGAKQQLDAQALRLKQQEQQLIAGNAELSSLQQQIAERITAPISLYPHSLAVQSNNLNETLDATIKPQGYDESKVAEPLAEENSALTKVLPIIIRRGSLGSNDTDMVMMSSQAVLGKTEKPSRARSRSASCSLLGMFAQQDERIKPQVSSVTEDTVISRVLDVPLLN